MTRHPIRISIGEGDGPPVRLAAALVAASMLVGIGWRGLPGSFRSAAAMGQPASSQTGRAPRPSDPTTPAAAPRVLLDSHLEPHRIKLISINDEALVYQDELGRLRQATVGGFVALLPASPDDISLAYPAIQPPPATNGSDGVLELVSGERFPGRPDITAGQDDALVWRHPRFGRITIPIDSIARLALTAPHRSQSHAASDDDAGAGRPAGQVTTTRHDGPDARPISQTPLLGPGSLPYDPAAIDDQLILTNGDRLHGIILSLGDPIEIDVDDHMISIPLDRLSEAAFANPPSPLTGMVIWLDDGAVAVVTGVETLRESNLAVRLRSGETATVPLDSLRAVAFSAGRLRALASLEITSQRPLGDRGVWDPVRELPSAFFHGAADLNAPDLELPGPMEAVWLLPAGAVRFAGNAEFPLEALPWGDCEFVVSQGGVELLRERLNQDHPRVEFSLPVMPGALVITIEAGAYGPINDRIVLRRPLLLTE